MKKGFTLAEVLITLGVIGVVAAITMPTLINNYKKSAYVSKFKHTYSLLQQAIALSQVENGPLDTWDYSADPTDDANRTAFAEKYITPYLKIIKNCGTRTGKGCLPEKIIMLNSSKWPYGGIDSTGGYKIVLSNGVSLNIEYGQNCVENKTYCISFSANTEGNKKEVYMGRNQFYYDAYPGLNQIYPRGMYNNSADAATDSSGNWKKRTQEELEKACIENKNHSDWCGGLIVLDGYKMNY